MRLALFGVVLASYLLGSFPTSYVVVYRLTGRDIRTMGTGNPGAMNVLDSVGPLPALFVALTDVAKGAAAVGMAFAFGLGEVGALVAAFAAVIGHDYSIFLRLDGGNGTATGIGAATMLLPFPGLIAFSAGVAVALVLQNRRLGGLTAMAAYPISARLLEAPPIPFYGGVALIALTLLQIIRDEGFHLSAVRHRTDR